jgi:hypothetical protein
MILFGCFTENTPNRNLVVAGSRRRSGDDLAGSLPSPGSSSSSFSSSSSKPSREAADNDDHEHENDEPYCCSSAGSDLSATQGVARAGSAAFPVQPSKSQDVEEETAKS